MVKTDFDADQTVAAGGAIRRAWALAMSESARAYGVQVYGAEADWLRALAYYASCCHTVTVADRMYSLSCVVRVAAEWFSRDAKITASEVENLCLVEFVRAHKKHNGNTPFSPSMADRDRYFILMEEVGEVARALTPDAGTATGHGGDLHEELVQVATMALIWLARTIEDKGAKET